MYFPKKRENQKSLLTKFLGWGWRIRSRCRTSREQFLFSVYCLENLGKLLGNFPNSLLKWRFYKARDGFLEISQEQEVTPSMNQLPAKYELQRTLGLLCSSLRRRQAKINGFEAPEAYFYLI